AGGRTRCAPRPRRASGTPRPAVAAPRLTLSRRPGKAANAARDDRVELRTARAEGAAALPAARGVQGKLLARGGRGRGRRRPQRSRVAPAQESRSALGYTPWPLDTIREYARERLEESPEAEEIHRRHAEFFLAVAESA